MPQYRIEFEGITGDECLATSKYGYCRGKTAIQCPGLGHADCPAKLVTDDIEKYLIHGIAKCADCDWHTENYLTLQKDALLHHQQTGHHVKMDLGYYCEHKKEKP